MRRSSVLYSFAYALASSGCRTDRVTELRVDFVAGTYVIRLTSGASLEQRVVVTPPTPQPNDTILISSVILNPSANPITVETSICGLHLKGAEEFRDPFVHCDGYSTTGPIAPGDSVQDRRVLLAPLAPGNYVIEVRELVTPSVWVPLTITVQPM